MAGIDGRRRPHDAVGRWHGSDRSRDPGSPRLEDPAAGDLQAERIPRGRIGRLNDTLSRGTRLGARGDIGGPGDTRGSKPRNAASLHRESAQGEEEKGKKHFQHTPADRGSDPAASQYELMGILLA